MISRNGLLIKKAYCLTKCLLHSERGRVRDVLKLSRPQFHPPTPCSGSFWFHDSKGSDVNLTASAEWVEGPQERQSSWEHRMLNPGCELGLGLGQAHNPCMALMESMVSNVEVTPLSSAMPWPSRYLPWMKGMRKNIQSDSVTQTTQTQKSPGARQLK